MNPSHPVEEGPHLRSRALSPVSPKPLRFPNPSSLPVLENQMDLTFNDTSTYLSLKDRQQPETSFTMSVPGQTQDYPTNGDRPADAQASAGSDTDYGMSVDSSSSDTGNNQAPATVPFLNQTNDNAPNGESDNAFAPAEAESAPSPASDFYDGETVASHDPVGYGTDLPTSLSEDQPIRQPDNAGDPKASGEESSGVNFQALLDNISASTSAAPHSTQTIANTTTLSPDHATDASPSYAPAVGKSPAPLPLGANLPPRPPPQENPSNYPLASEIYHMHDQPSAIQKYGPPPGTILRPPGNLPPPLSTAGAPGTSLGANGLPPPPLATFQQRPPSTAQQPLPSPSTPSSYRQREPLERRDSPDSKINEEEDAPWPAEIQKVYDEFLAAERTYVTQGEWDKFPPNSRLFIGNLPSEKVTKRDLFHVFHKYGKLAQVSIKQAYGFVQYLDTAACSRALDAEQGVSIRGRKIHLEISKPQRNSKDKGAGDNRGGRNRRSRSPDYTRGAVGTGNQNRADRYRGGGNNRQRDAGRGRDDYRPGRSPSPRSRGRDGFRVRDRSADRYNGRRRSRSRSPYGRDGRVRSPSRRSSIEDDGCPLPRRDPSRVPDVQIIAKGEPGRPFISHVERTFEARGVRCDVLILSSKLSEAAVVRRQIVEGVLAVMKLDRLVESTQKYPLTIFDRAKSVGNVSFDEYTNLDLNICVELVLRAKNPPPQAQYNAAAYAASQYGLPIVQPQIPVALQPPQSYQQQQHVPAVPPPFPMDASSLQQLLGRVQQQTSSNTQQQLAPHFPPPTQANTPRGAQPQIPPATDLSRLLASATAAAQQQQQSQNPYQQHHASQPQNSSAPNPNQYSSLASNPAWASLFANARPTSAHQSVQPQQAPAQQQQGGPAQVDMSHIMAQLARYGR